MRGIFATEEKNPQRKKQGQKIVYLVGAGPGAGVTHTGILLAEFLVEKRGARTLFLEMNRHKDISCIPQGLLAADYRSRPTKRQLSLWQRDYDYIVADLGTDFHGRIEGEQLEASGLLIGSGAFWKKERFCQTAEALRELRPEILWQGVLSLGSREVALQLSRELSLPVGALGWQPLGAPLTENGENLFLSLLRRGKSKIV